MKRKGADDRGLIFVKLGFNSKTNGKYDSNF